MSDHPGKQKLDELVAGLDGVTPGPWASRRYMRCENDRRASLLFSENTTDSGPRELHIGTVGRHPGILTETADLNAAHIARCDPDAIRSISDAYKAMERERDALRREAEELVVAQYRISALEAAISRQVENIERWMETGKAAGPEESKSIYEQMKAALANTSGREGDHTCPICAKPFKSGDLCASDITEGTCHAVCLEGSPVVDLTTGEPSHGPVDTFTYGQEGGR